MPHNQLFTAITGGLPRTRSYAIKVRRFEKGRISIEELEREAFTQTKKIYFNLGKALPDYLTDGMFLCDDILNPFIKDIENVSQGGLSRFFENNFFVRTPIIKGEINLKKEPIHLQKRISLIHNLRSEGIEKRFRLPLPGPLTFTYFAKIKNGYQDNKKLIQDYIRNVIIPTGELLIKQEIVPEIHEPALEFFDKETIMFFWKEMKEALSAENIPKTHLITYFGSKKIVLLIEEYSKVVFGIDLVETKFSKKTLEDLIAKNELQLGVLDSRNTRMEKKEKIIETWLSILEKGKKDIIISTNTTLDFLPEIIAYRKIRLLYKIKKAFEGN